MALAEEMVVQGRVLAGKVALVTGGSRGIGAAIARELASLGATTVLNYCRSAEQAEALVRQLSEHNDRVAALKADVSQPEEIDRLWNEVSDRFGPIDILVNNAGITRDSRFLNMSAAQWEDVMHTNLDSMFHLTQRVLPSMIENGFGRIINVSSIIAQTGGFGQVNYSAAKAGIIGFTKSLALETAKYNITVNAVCPGFIWTDMVAAVPEKVQDKIKAKIPMGRFGLPEEVAKVVRFLVVDGDYITGQCLNVNGGMYM
ncbi:3-oxoacyl-[acyl-carrier-protein] reductase [Kyrpidia spormannii]|uniref:3-oxoacyl-[acyl-carrier-protein] reductase n=1 Tax=Kyrpidia spormannii TaxID=2055160 RepID=A0A2K8N785_9BACL|nr:3-oxoacyl-[acyl-carrier-protein] reductase [Kyrpidia spormannii]ATY84955.1 3-oxoacyl-[acyl-carrier-protein] reductase [Kyrpidia spormannii]